MQIDPGTIEAIFDSMTERVMFVDNDHIVRYLNKAAAKHYRGGYDLIGTSIFDCHNEKSNDTIRAIYAEMLTGLEERLITDNARHRVYMRAVRAANGELLGYYERYEPPRP